MYYKPKVLNDIVCKGLLEDDLKCLWSYTYIILLVCILAYLLLIIYTKCSTIFNRNSALRILQAAIMNNDVVTSIEIIAKYPSIINSSVNGTGYTPFLIACSQGNTQLVKFMLSMGADIFKVTVKNESAAYLAVYSHIRNPEDRNASCLHALFYAGADINAPTAYGYTPLQLAATFGHTSLVSWLLSKGANTAVYPHPYLLAMANGHLRTAKFLEAKQQLSLTA